VTLSDEPVDVASARLTRTARGPGPSGLPPATITRAARASAELQRWADDRVSQQAKRATTDYRGATQSATRVRSTIPLSSWRQPFYSTWPLQ
jgi:hypothetical protein